MDLFDLSISNSPASLMLIIPDRPDHSLRQQDAPPPQGTASEPSTLTTRHRPTAHRDERTGAPASQRSASQSRHDWKRRHQAAARRDGPGTRLSRNRGTARKDAYQRPPPARVSSRSALDARTQTRRCPPGGGGAGGRLQDPIARLVRLAHGHWSGTWFSRPPPHAKIIESDRAAMFGVAQHFFLQSCCRPSDLIPKREHFH